MKKYLIRGTLALFAWAFVVGCAEKESDFIPLAEQKAMNFEQVFKEAYGEVDPYQDWGFSSGKVEVDPNDSSVVVNVVDLSANVAVTRALAFGGLHAGTRDNGNSGNNSSHANPNGNEWYKDYDVPYALTWHQKDIVRRYFQQVQDPGGSCPEWSDFFVQQVYKGGTNVTSDSRTTETYTAGNGNVFIGSNKMNKLTCADKNKNRNIHISNYNNANCSGRSDIKHKDVYSDGYTPWTLENYDKNKGWSNCVSENNNHLKQFSDTIMLMENCSTHYFGYENSLQSSNTYNDMFRCVVGDSIMAWARRNNIQTYSDGDVTGMYFVGFDYEADKNHGNAQNSNEYIVKEVTSTTQGAFQIGGKWYLDSNGARDHYYSDWIVRIVPGEGLPVITNKEEETSDDTWTQVESGRVFCEDLGQSTREDLDFNDLVFDAIIFKNHKYYKKERVEYEDGVEKSRTVIEGPTEATKYYANVTILAAGGTIPITIESNKEGSVSYQVHDQFDPVADVATMINTRDNNSTAYGSFEERDPVQIGDISKSFSATLSDGSTKQYDVKLFEIDTPEDEENVRAIKDIIVTSSFGSGKQIQQITAETGNVPRKFMAPIGTNWTSERKNISLAYPLFGEWVKGNKTLEECFSTQAHIVDRYLYTGSYSADGLQLPLVMKARSNFITDNEATIWEGSQVFGDSWNLTQVSAILPAKLNIDKFYPGDRLRFYGADIKDEAWVTVVINNTTPYFIDTEFPNYTIDSSGVKTAVSSGCIEVQLNEDDAEKLNTMISDGQLQIQVQGRNFTLARISRVLFQ